jgi:demethylmenaquinone methyltransferase/2-methoxy-6-polyprenyl-1,4-benzoquinol methylase
MASNEGLVSKIFDSVVKTYDKFLTSVTFGRINAWQRELVKNTPNLDLVLDVGTGTGEVIKKIKEINPKSKVIGLDIAFNMLKKAKEKVSDAFYMKASAYKIPIKDKSLNTVVSSLVFRHLDNEKALKEFDRVLKDGGYISILDIAKPNPIIYKTIFFFANVIFRPIGQIIFSKEEYDYFMESIENSKTEAELEKLFSKYSYKKIYSSKKFLGMVLIIVFKKETG